jgi:hypothetical protein
MTRLKYLVAAAAVALIGAWPLSTSVQAAEDPHHPAGAAVQAAPQTPTAPSAGGQAGTMGGQGMMGGMPMMNMMNMMGMMQMMGDAPGMGMIDHVEGRIAFLRTELKITDAQADVWNAFATALRSNAQNLGAARRGMMGQMGAGQPQAQTLTQRLDAQERWLSARLEGTRSLKTAFTGLYGALSDEQKKTADEILAPHMGMGMMAMMPMGQSGPSGRGAP